MHGLFGKRSRAESGQYSDGASRIGRLLDLSAARQIPFSSRAGERAHDADDKCQPINDMLVSQKITTSMKTAINFVETAVRSDMDKCGWLGIDFTRWNRYASGTFW